LTLAFWFPQAEIKRLTALVEEAAQKNRKLIALGSKSCPLAVLSQCYWPWRSFSPFPFLVAEAQAKALAEAREGFVKESFYREAEFRAQQAEEARKRAKAEAAELTKVLEQKGRELEDVIAEYKVKLEAATDARDSARGAAASLREELAALKQQHAKELAAEKEASEGIVLAVQAEKTNFEAFVREMSRQILGKFLLSQCLF
jgi:cystathionine beta-lyase/cystathionine gamma-synthase